ncbi:MAG: T9SS type A sorting domain-containing protein, partial [Cyclobacteriaceae bacterium]|nr:T9SS type A sorting domain-containing protein [Cyclobacteriaceae bacterium]
AMEDADGIIWIGDSRNGLFTNQGNAYVPNGVSFSETFRLGRDAAQAIYAVSGGYSTTFQPLGKNERVNSFSSGLWNINTSFVSQDVTDIAFSGSKAFVASFGSGLQVIENGIETIFTSSNSPLSTNRITALAISNDGAWITNYGGAQSLHLLKADGTWESFSFPYSGSQNPLQLVVDQIGQVWMALNHSVGGGLIVFNRKENKSVLLSEVVGAGALPSRQVYSLAVDRNGQVWVGTAAGVAYFTNPSQVFSGNVNSIKPIYNGRFLLRDETVTALAVDGGNRKWIGTLRGTWLFNPFGEEEIYNFNTGNSPLLSDKISDIEINPVTGEVFFATEKGIISFRSDATSSENDFNEVKIFPNPVAADFNGLISISGLATDARIKVIDISGKLVWQTIANGGTATWNARDYNGRRAATGMYLVIAVSQDGSESVIGKIAVLN